MPGSPIPSVSAIEAMGWGAQPHKFRRWSPGGLSTSAISSRSISPPPIPAPEPPAIGAGTEPLAVPAARHHRAGHEPMPGRLADSAPISCAGTVLSQPPISTTASIGWARIISSVSIAIDCGTSGSSG